MKKSIILLAGLAGASAAVAANVNPARPMVTGRGNVTVRPVRVIVTNQTAAAEDDTVKLDKLIITGSLLKAKPRGR